MPPPVSGWKIATGVLGGAAGLAAGVGATAVAVGRLATGREQVDLAERFAPLPVDRCGTVTADDGVRLWYEEAGPADAPLTAVFIPGFALSLGIFYFQRQALAQRFGDRLRMVFYDPRGHGRSERGDPARATIDQLGQDLSAVLDALAPTGPVVLVGHSMGGMTVMALAQARPELFTARRVAGVVLVSTSTGKLGGVTLGLPSLVAKLRAPLLPLLLRGARHGAGLVERSRALGADLAWVITRRLSFASDDADPARVEYLNAMIAATRIEVIADFYPTLMSHDRRAALPVLAGVRTVIICGDKDLLTPIAHSVEMAGQLAKASFVVIPRGGHVALLERPQLVTEPIAELIEDTLRDIARRRLRHWWRPFAGDPQ
ncbi:MAG: alpha/beta hydrolase [Actinomycetia bacterium]|nr:alpha/beta hydrolase [Actinomycetes bacterium]